MVAVEAVALTGDAPGQAAKRRPILWAMGEVRRNLLNTLARIERAGLEQAFYDWRGPDGADNSVGSLPYHVAGVELGWWYFDLLGTGLPADLKELFPFDDRTEEGNRRLVKDVPIDDQLARLERALRLAEAQCRSCEAHCAKQAAFCVKYGDRHRVGFGTKRTSAVAT